MATYQVGASSNDCARRLATTAYFSLTEISNPTGYSTASAYKIGCGMRFTSIAIPKGSTINQAYLSLRADVPATGTIVRSRISAEDVDDAAIFSTAADFDTRWAARTTARVNWDGIPAWTGGVDYDSPEIKTVIQEIVDRAGWASGNDIVIFWEDFEDRSDHNANSYRSAYSYDSSTTYAPKLVITHTPRRPRPHFQIIGY